MMGKPGERQYETFRRLATTGIAAREHLFSIAW